MLKLSKLADYAFVILSQMTSKPENNWSASALASETTLPLPTVAKLMKLLARGKIVEAQRGATGGYRLSNTPTQISIAQIIEAVDGPITLTECAGQATGKDKCDCAVGGKCPVRENWQKVNTAIRSSLESVTLFDLSVTPQSP